MKQLPQKGQVKEKGRREGTKELCWISMIQSELQGRKGRNLKHG